MKGAHDETIEGWNGELMFGGALVLADDGFIYVQAAGVPALNVKRVSPDRIRLARERCIGSGVVVNRTLLFTAFHLAS